ncbi:hypothetical protein [Streptomyces sp. NPDC054786]
MAVCDALAVGDDVALTARPHIGARLLGQWRALDHGMSLMRAL